MNKSMEILAEVLGKNEDLVVDGMLDKNMVAELARKYDKGLLTALCGDKNLKKLFFEDIDGQLVFKKDIFLQFISQKEFLPDSYTKFSQTIGLATANGDLLSSDNRVVLNWPYKDCVLEGGQTKEDQKRDEVFFNEILAPDQISTILEDKVFTNWKRYDKDGEHKLDKLNPDDNLIIKGNNLLVLHSLKKRFAGRVKLIYIDPPFYFMNNPSQDTFMYNSNFKLSTWLTFMKNRLQIARDLLSTDGSMFIHIDWQGVHYLKILAEEVFGRQNYQSQIVWRREVARGRKGESKFFGHNADYILVFSKNKEEASFKPVKKLKELNADDLKDYYQDEKGYFSTSDPGTYTDESLIDFYDKGLIFITKNGEAIIDRKNKTFKTTTGTPRVKYYLKEVDGKYYKEFYVDDIWDDIAGIATQAGERVGFSSQKPEALIKRLLDAVTEPGDIVMDYHLGSGTTAAVAHKMGRQYIGIEQLYYGESDSINRMTKVLSGDQSGISKFVGFDGGGSFVYCNIKNDANTFREKVTLAKEADLSKLLDEVLKSSFLSYRVDPKKVNKKEFEKLNFADKKRILCKLIDNNTLYMNYSEIDDASYDNSAEDKKFNKQFYTEID